MNNFKTLVCGDFHLSDRKYKNKDLEDFEEEVQKGFVLGINENMLDMRWVR